MRIGILLPCSCIYNFRSDAVSPDVDRCAAAVEEPVYGEDEGYAFYGEVYGFEDDYHGDESGFGDACGSYGCEGGGEEDDGEFCRAEGYAEEYQDEVVRDPLSYEQKVAYVSQADDHAS